MASDIRDRIVEEALSWHGTPRILGGKVKGVGCDCITFPVETLANSGAVPRSQVNALYAEFGVYHDDWFLHLSEQRYMMAMMRLGRKITETRCYASVKTDPGNLVLIKCANSRMWNHGGIVIQWPTIIHCMSKVVQVDASRDPMWANHELAIFSPLSE